MKTLPKILHRIWVGPEMPSKLVDIGVQWQNMLPDWKHILWNEESLDWLVNKEFYDRAEELVPPDAVGQFRADVARYEILNSFGGVYVDCDLEPLRSIDELHIHSAWAGWERQGTQVGNTILGGEAGNQFWKRAIDELPSSVQNNPGKRPHQITGPHFVTRLYQRYKGLYVYPERFFYPYGCQQLDRHKENPGNSYTRHLWWHQRTLKGKFL